MINLLFFIRFGSPYTIQVSRETLYGDLQKLLMKEMSGILHDDILISQQKVPLFKIRVLDGLDSGEGAYLDSSVDMPMYTLAIEQAINICTVTGQFTYKDDFRGQELLLNLEAFFEKKSLTLLVLKQF